MSPSVNILYNLFMDTNTRLSLDTYNELLITWLSMSLSLSWTLSYWIPRKPFFLPLISWKPYSRHREKEQHLPRTYSVLGPTPTDIKVLSIQRTALRTERLAQCHGAASRVRTQDEPLWARGAESLTPCAAHHGTEPSLAAFCTHRTICTTPLEGLTGHSRHLDSSRTDFWKQEWEGCSLFTGFVRIKDAVGPHRDYETNLHAAPSVRLFM